MMGFLHYLLWDILLYPPATMVWGGLLYTWLVVVPNPPIAKWRHVVGQLGAFAGIVYFVVMLIIGISHRGIV